MFDLNNIREVNSHDNPHVTLVTLPWSGEHHRFMTDLIRENRQAASVLPGMDIIEISGSVWAGVPNGGMLATPASARVRGIHLGNFSIDTGVEDTGDEARIIGFIEGTGLPLAQDTNMFTLDRPRTVISLDQDQNYKRKYIYLYYRTSIQLAELLYVSGVLPYTETDTAAGCVVGHIYEVPENIRETLILAGSCLGISESIVSLYLDPEGRMVITDTSLCHKDLAPERILAGKPHGEMELVSYIMLTIPMDSLPDVPDRDAQDNIIPQLFVRASNRYIEETADGSYGRAVGVKTYSNLGNARTARYPDVELLRHTDAERELLHTMLQERIEAGGCCSEHTVRSEPSEEELLIMRRDLERLSFRNTLISTPGTTMCRVLRTPVMLEKLLNHGLCSKLNSLSETYVMLGRYCMLSRTNVFRPFLHKMACGDSAFWSSIMRAAVKLMSSDPCITELNRFSVAELMCSISEDANKLESLTSIVLRTGNSPSSDHDRCRILRSDSNCMSMLDVRTRRGYVTPESELPVTYNTVKMLELAQAGDNDPGRTLLNRNPVKDLFARIKYDRSASRSDYEAMAQSFVLEVIIKTSKSTGCKNPELDTGTAASSETIQGCGLPDLSRYAEGLARLASDMEVNYVPMRIIYGGAAHVKDELEARSVSFLQLDLGDIQAILLKDDAAFHRLVGIITDDRPEKFNRAAYALTMETDPMGHASEFVNYFISDPCRFLTLAHMVCLTYEAYRDTDYWGTLRSLNLFTCYDMRK